MNHEIVITNQDKFLLYHKRNHKQISAWRILLFLSFLIYWELGARLGWIDTFFFSSPIGVMKCTLQLFITHNLIQHIGYTLLETILSFLLVFLISLLISTWLWYSEKLSSILEPYWVILNSLPKSALAPLFIVWFGTGIKTIIIAGISVAIFGSIISFHTAFHQADSDKITLIKTLGGSKKDAFIKVVLPSSIPFLLNTTKVNIGLSLVGVIIGEFLAAKRGLGYLIIYGSQVFQLDMVITSIIILLFIAMGFFKGIQWIEHEIKKKMKF